MLSSVSKPWPLMFLWSFSSFLACSEIAHTQALQLSAQSRGGKPDRCSGHLRLQLQLPSLCHPGLRPSQAPSPQDTSPAQTNTFWAFLFPSLPYKTPKPRPPTPVGCKVRPVSTLVSV